MLDVLNIVIPVFFIAFAGFLYGKGVTADVAEVNRINLNLDARRKKPVHLVLDEAHRYIKKHYDYLLKENI